MSTVPLQTRTPITVLVETEPSENSGIFSCPAFAADSQLVAAYDSGSGRIKIFQASDLSVKTSFKPNRWPMGLGFSPNGNFLAIKAYPGWVEDHLHGKSPPAQMDINAPEAIQDNIQRVEVLNIHDGRSIPDLCCDGVSVLNPQGGWLWAKKWAIVPGYRSAAILASYFSPDETAFSVLCWNGGVQSWDTRSWNRTGNSPPPPFWDTVARYANAEYWAGNAMASGSADGRFIVLNIREGHLGFGTIYIWDRSLSGFQRRDMGCGVRALPVQSLTVDGSKLAACCNKGMGMALHVMDLSTGHQIPLKDGDLGFTQGYPLIRAQGVALSPDGRFLAAALIQQDEGLVVSVIPGLAGAIQRSDLRIWDLKNNGEYRTFPIDDLVNHASYFQGVDLSFSPDSTLLAVGGRRLRILKIADLIQQQGNAK